MGVMDDLFGFDDDEAEPSAVKVAEPPKVTKRSEPPRREEPATPAPEKSSHKMKEPHQWGPEELRDYVVTEAWRRTGPFVRQPAKEVAIFKRFCSAHGEMAGPIAVEAMETHRGIWMGGPVRPLHFAERFDVDFADPLKKNLERNAL